VVADDLVDDSPVERTNTMNSNHSTSRADHPSSRSGRNRGVAAGLTLGVIGGTAAGLVFGIPGLTNAASSDVAVTPAAIVQQVGDDSVTEAPESRPEPGTRMREAIQSLVDDGTITADQADAVVAQLVESAPDRGERSENRGERREARQDRRQAPEAVQALLGLSADELREQLRAGSSLADIATAQGVDPQAVVDAIVAEMTERLDAAVAEGKLDADAAAEKLAQAQERVAERVNNSRD
jgi:polyhydroxyalkanoate synthesis regulator phasin